MRAIRWRRSGADSRARRPHRHRAEVSREAAPAYHLRVHPLRSRGRSDSDAHRLGGCVTRKKKSPTPSLVRSSAAEYLTFVAATGGGGVEAVYADENVWLSQKMMGLLYDVDVRTINYHLKTIFSDSELQEEAVIRNFRITASDGKTYDTKHYNLSATIAVGYKVNSERAVQFRKWATRVVEEFTIKGFAMDDERLKRGGSILGDRYFEEQLQRVREIRLSERKFYQKITDIYATAVDYDLTAQATKRFFATVQNKLHWAIHGHTAAEVIVGRADAAKEHMGLHTWADAPVGKIQKFDVVVAKNYLTEPELLQLARLVNAYLDVAEDMALRKIPLTMQDWETRLNRFIAATDREVLSDAGKVTAEIAKAHAESEFEKYRIVQDRMFESDFDRVVAETKQLQEKTKTDKPRKSRKGGKK
ncbi:MAG: virulence RhuM family protein [Deltaproteobacteria bacterium]|nr:virulence RhuM family protein [Deltaproteobacteria bacterium]